MNNKIQRPLPPNQRENFKNTFYTNIKRVEKKTISRPLCLGRVNKKAIKRCEKIRKKLSHSLQSRRENRTKISTPMSGCLSHVLVGRGNCYCIVCKSCSGASLGTISLPMACLIPSSAEATFAQSTRMQRFLINHLKTVMLVFIR